MSRLSSRFLIPRKILVPLPHAPAIILSLGYTEGILLFGPAIDSKILSSGSEVKAKCRGLHSDRSALASYPISPICKMRRKTLSSVSLIEKTDTRYVIIPRKRQDQESLQEVLQMGVQTENVQKLLQQAPHTADSSPTYLVSHPPGSVIFTGN